MNNNNNNININNNNNNHTNNNNMHSTQHTNFSLPTMTSSRAHRTSIPSPARFFRLEPESESDMDIEDSNPGDQQHVEEQDLPILLPTVYSPPRASREQVSKGTTQKTVVSCTPPTIPSSVSPPLCFPDTRQQSPFYDTSAHDDDMAIDFEAVPNVDTHPPCGVGTPSPDTEYSFAGNDDPFDRPAPIAARMGPPFSPQRSHHRGQQLYTYNQTAVSHGSDPIATPAAPDPGGYVMVGHVPFAVGEIRAMAENIARAQECNEFPRYQASFLNDANIVVNDFRLLNELRRARGNPADPTVPPEYAHLRIKIAADLARRLGLIGLLVGLGGAARRVEAYLRVNDHEVQCFNNATGALQRGVQPSQMDLEDIAEAMVDAVEHGLADAAAPIRFSVGRMGQQIERVEDMTDVLDDQIHMVNRQACDFNNNNRTFNNHLQVMGHQFYKFNDAMNHQVYKFNDVMNQVAKCHESMNYQVDRVEAHFSRVAHQTKAIEAQMHALSAMINTHAATQSVLNDNLARSNKVLDTLADVASAIPGGLGDHVFQAHVDAAVQRALQAKHTGPQNTTDRASPRAGADFQPRNRRGIKRVLGKFLGRREEDDSPLTFW